MDSINNYSFLLRHVYFLVNALERTGVSKEKACEILDIPLRQMYEISDGERISAERFIYSCKKANEYSGDKLFCFKSGLDASFMDFSIWGGYLSQFRSIKELWDAYIDLFHYFQNFGKPYWEQMDAGLGMVNSLDEQLSRFAAEVIELRMGITIKISRIFSRDAYPGLIREVHFQHDSTVDPSIYSKQVGLPVKFNQRYTGMIFDEVLIEEALNVPDMETRAFFQRKINESVFGEKSDTIQQIEAIIERLGHFNFNQSDLADELGLSVSSLKRILNKENTSYQKTIDRLKIDKAKSMLMQKNSSVESISIELGYSSISSFSQAFNRVVGVSPSTFRKDSKLS